MFAMVVDDDPNDHIFKKKKKKKKQKQKNKHVNNALAKISNNKDMFFLFCSRWKTLKHKHSACNNYYISKFISENSLQIQSYADEF